MYGYVVKRNTRRLYIFKRLHVALERLVLFRRRTCLGKFGHDITAQILVACHIIIFTARLEENSITALLRPILAERLGEVVRPQVTVFRQRKSNRLLRRLLPVKLNRRLDGVLGEYIRKPLELAVLPNLKRLKSIAVYIVKYKRVPFILQLSVLAREIIVSLLKLRPQSRQRFITLSLYLRRDKFLHRRAKPRHGLYSRHHPVMFQSAFKGARNLPVLVALGRKDADPAVLHHKIAVADPVAVTLICLAHGLLHLANCARRIEQAAAACPDNPFDPLFNLGAYLVYAKITRKPESIFLAVLVAGTDFTDKIPAVEFIITVVLHRLRRTVKFIRRRRLFLRQESTLGLHIGFLRARLFAVLLVPPLAHKDYIRNHSRPLECVVR